MMKPIALAVNSCVIGTRRRAGGGDLAHRRAQRIGCLHGTAALVNLAPEDLDHAVSRDHLLQHVRDRAGAGLHVARQPPQAPAEVPRDDGDDRQHDRRQEREAPVDPQEITDARCDRDRRACRRHDGSRGGRRELVRVERQLREHDAGRGHVVIRRGQRQHLVDQLAAQVEHHPVARPGHPVLGDERADAAQHEHADDDERQHVGAHRIGVLEIPDDRNHEIRHDEVARSDDHHATDGYAERPPVGTHVAKQAKIEMHAGQGMRRTAGRADRA